MWGEFGISHDGLDGGASFPLFILRHGTPARLGGFICAHGSGSAALIMEDCEGGWCLVLGAWCRLILAVAGTIVL